MSHKLREVMHAAGVAYLAEALARHDGSIADTARELGLTYEAVRAFMRRHGMRRAGGAR